MIKRFIQANIAYRESKIQNLRLSRYDMVSVCQTDKERDLIRDTFSYQILNLGISWHDLCLAFWQLFTPLDKKS